MIVPKGLYTIAGGETPGKIATIKISPGGAI